MVRSPCVDHNGMNKGAWSEEEDDKLRAYIQRHGHWNWRLLPKFAGLARCGKSCRLRWVNYLRPGLKKGDFTKQEEDLIIQLHAELGNKWSAIAAKLPGRTDNEIKNFWHTRIDRRRRKNPTKNNKGRTNHKPKPNSETTTSKDPTSFDANNPSPFSLTELPQEDYNYFPSLPEEDLFSSKLNYSEISNSDSSDYLSVLEWINADDDHISISSDYVSDQLAHGDFWAEIFSYSIWNSESEIFGYVPPCESGRIL